jgi:RND family efflux transporter MFP subunit
MSNKIFFCVGSIGVLIIGTASWVVLKDIKLKPHNSSCVSPEIRPVPTAVAQRLNRNIIRIFPGKTRANRRVKLAFSISGLLEKLNAQEGRSVKKGEILAQLDQRDYQQKLEVARAKYLEERNAFKRCKVLWQKRVISKSSYETALAECNIAKAELLMCQKALKDTVLKAPFDGTIARRYVENYEHIKDKTPVLLLQDISRVEVVIQVPERLIAQVGVGGLNKIQVHFDVENYCWLDASVRESSIQSNSSSRTYDVVVSLIAPRNLKILPGMTASVKFETLDQQEVSGDNKNMALVPNEAVWSNGNGKSYVWAISPKGGLPQKKLVTLGELRNDGIEIISGICPGEHVATAGIHKLQENAPVRSMTKGKWGLDG